MNTDKTPEELQDEREAEFMKEVSREEPYRHYNKARELQLKINQFNRENEDGHYD